jgi:1-acylglycerone phosphate reductase
MKRSILITGCSDGGLGAELARAFHATGRWCVFATARNLDKMAGLVEAGIETSPLDVMDEESVKSCADQIKTLTGGRLDALLLNAGGGLSVCISSSVGAKQS